MATMIQIVIGFFIVLFPAEIMSIAGKSYVMQPKALGILLFFQLMPVIYMIIKALFPDGTFTLQALQRLYTYPMNLTALRNTFIAAFVTMIIGTAMVAARIASICWSANAISLMPRGLSVMS